jgi:hypothetical protein
MNGRVKKKQNYYKNLTTVKKLQHRSFLNRSQTAKRNTAPCMHRGTGECEGETRLQQGSVNVYTAVRESVKEKQDCNREVLTCTPRYGRV